MIMALHPTIKKGAAVLSLTGLALIAGWEGLRTDAYLDPIGIPTICYGHIKTAKLGQTKTKDECITLLSEESKEYVQAVHKYVYVPLTQGQLDALVSFTYNVGAGNLASSTLRRKLNAGDYCGAAREFPRWNKAGGRVLKGLTARRLQEQEFFLRGVDCVK